MCLCVRTCPYLSWRGACPCIFMSPQYIWLLLQPPVTCVWLCSIPAPIAPLWESIVMTECCWAFAAVVPRTPGSMGVHSFALGWRRPSADQFVILLHPFLQNVVFLRRISEAGLPRHLCHPSGYMCPETLD